MEQEICQAFRNSRDTEQNSTFASVRFMNLNWSFPEIFYIVLMDTLYVPSWVLLALCKGFELGKGHKSERPGTHILVEFYTLHIKIFHQRTEEE